MKKIIVIIIIILVMAILPIAIMFSEYKNNKNEINKFNLVYEKYLEKEIYGAEVGSIINNAINNNVKYNIEKDENNKYIDDNKNCIIIELNIPIFNEKGEEEEDIYRMEVIEELEVERFVKNFSTYKFKIQEIRYNNLNKVNYIKIKMVF